MTHHKLGTVVFNIRHGSNSNKKNCVYARRDLRDKLGKAATAADYRVYETEKQMRVKMEIEVSRYRDETAMTRDEVRTCRHQ